MSENPSGPDDAEVVELVDLQDNNSDIIKHSQDGDLEQR